jgi:type II secretory pathway pseudopilin PulG
MSILRARRSVCRSCAAFTILELLIVITIIIVLAGLILATVGYVQKKGARSRAEAEIAAMSAALENYKADNGVYPTGSATEGYGPQAAIDFSKYNPASKYLYGELTGDNEDFNGANDTANEQKNKSYFSFKPQLLGRTDMSQPPSSSNPVSFLRDPFGNSYGYSTVQAKTGSGGYNPTFDLWSTGGVVSATNPPDQTQWIKNW